MIGPPFARRARMTVALGDAWSERFGRGGGSDKEPGNDRR